MIIKQSKDLLSVSDVGGEHDPNIQVEQQLKKTKLKLSCYKSLVTEYYQ